MRNIHEQIQNTSENIDVNGLSWKEKVFQYPNRTIRIGTTFSGIGAIEHAFQRLGLNFKIQFAGDIEPNCKKAYFANYKIAENRWHNDIHDFNAKPYDGEIDLLVGGAPCQAFSYAGKRLGLEDARGTLFYHYAVFLEKLQPKMFLFENVRGLLTHDHGKTYSAAFNRGTGKNTACRRYRISDRNYLYFP